MNKYLAIIFSTVLLSACGGEDDGESSSSVSQASSSSQTTTSSSVGSSSSTPDLVGNAQRGEDLYVRDSNMNCIACHSADGKTPPLTAPLDPSKGYYQYQGSGPFLTLAEYISTYMPVGPTQCDAQCGADIAAYLATWDSNGGSSSSSSSVEALSCNQDVTYGPRGMRVLTRSEYINTIEDLTGIDFETDLPAGSVDLVPADSLVNGFSNNVNSIIEAAALKSYDQLASAIASWAAEQNFAGIVDCSAAFDDEDCASIFFDSFGKRAFRRPFTNSEKEAYYSLFASDLTGGDLNEGLKLAMAAILTSPDFLYRSELGLSIVDIENGTGLEEEYEPAGPVTTFTGADFSNPVVELYGRAELNSGGLRYTFTGYDLMSVTVRGRRGGDGAWSTMKIETNGGDFGSILVDHSGSKTYDILIEGQSGNPYIAFVNSPTNGHNPGHAFEIVNIDLSPAQIKVPELPPVTLDRDAYVLTPYETATLLAYTFTGTTPDDTLLQAAEDEALNSDEEIIAQVERLLESPRARKHFGDFAAQWLGTDRILEIGKDESIFPELTDDVRQAMAQEVRDVFNHVVLDEGAPFSTLYNSNYTFANGVLADFYGISGVSGTPMRKVTTTDRGGLVTSGAFLAVYAHDTKTSPIIRATRARRRFLCHDIPNPPNGVSLDEERKKSQEDFELLLEQHGGVLPVKTEYDFLTRSELCQTCHKEMINPLGFGFEDFDAIGLPQQFDPNGFEIDATGTLYGVESLDDGQEIPFYGAKDFASKIANLDSVRSCFIEQTFRLAMGTGPKKFDRNNPDIQLSQEEKQNYVCEMERLENTMNATNNSTRELLKTLGALEGLRYRKEPQR